GGRLTMILLVLCWLLPLLLTESTFEKPCPVDQACFIITQCGNDVENAEFFDSTTAPKVHKCRWGDDDRKYYRVGLKPINESAWRIFVDSNDDISRHITNLPFEAQIFIKVVEFEKVQIGDVYHLEFTGKANFYHNLFETLTNLKSSVIESYLKNFDSWNQLSDRLQLLINAT
ncbi:hypothetical protein PFISCL1PPCAC_3338, partial [Pristionchus fissidentatus]